MEGGISGGASKDQLVSSIYLEYRDELRQYVVRKYQFEKCEAEDLVHSAFARLNESDNVEDIRNPRAFLYKACNNAAIDQTRRTNVRSSYAETALSDPGEGDADANPERVSDTRQRLSILASLLEKMPDKRRRMLMMNRYEGLSYAEIGRRQNLSESVVRKHVARALEDCHKALKSKGIDLTRDD